MKKLIILFLLILISSTLCFAKEITNNKENKEQIVQEVKIPWPPDLSNVEKGNPDEAVWIYVTSRIDADDVPQNVKQFANSNGCFKILKSYHWSNPYYNYGLVYSCTKNKKTKYIIEKNGNIKFANWFISRKLYTPKYGY